MEDPAKEIEQVVSTITAAVNPEVQKSAVEKYYAANAEFRHPLCSVSSGPNSRAAILGIYQWYRAMSPHIRIEVQGVTYNQSTSEVFVEAVQEFHIRWSPFRPAPSRLLVHLKLKPSEADPNLLVIAYHEDFYHPTDFMALLVPPLVPLVHMMLKAGSLASNVNARLFALFGYWSVKDGERVDMSQPHPGSPGNTSSAAGLNDESSPSDKKND